MIALAGVGDLGRYVCEELQASPHFNVIVLTRAVSHLPLMSAKKCLVTACSDLHGSSSDVCSVLNRHGSRASKSAPSQQITQQLLFYRS